MHRLALPRISTASARACRMLAWICVFSAFCLQSAPQVWAQTGAVNALEAYEQALVQYRRGAIPEALQQIEAALAAAPENQRIRFDAIEIANSAGATQKAVALAAGQDLAQMPIYALSALGRAARRSADFARSQQAYDAILGKNPEDADAAIGRALALVGQREFDAATKTIDTLAGARTPAIEIAALEARALIAQAQNNDLEVLRFSNEMLRRDDTNIAALQMRFAALIRLGLPELARSAIPATTLTSAQRAKLAQDALALESRYFYTDEALREYRFRTDAVIDELAALPQQFAGVPAAQFEGGLRDRIALLADRGRFAEAYEALTPLLASQAAFPAWFSPVIAQVLLAQRAPVAAIQWFEKAFTEGVNDANTQVGYFFALLEAERADDALIYAKKMVDRARNPVAGEAIDQAAVLRFRVLWARALLYTDHVDAAWQAAKPLAEDAPANVEAALLRVETMATRGWPEQAEEELLWLLGENPRNINALTRLADTRLQRGNRVGARWALDEARSLDPENRAGLRSARDRAINDAPYARLDLGLARTLDSASIATADRERRAEMLVNSGWWQDQLRLTATGFHSQDTRANGAQIRRQGASLGAEWAQEDISAQLSVLGDDAGNVGISLRGAWAMDDRWRLTGDVGRNDAQLPLRALASNISQTAVRIGLGYRAHESTAVNLGLASAQLTDGNVRTEINLNWTQRWRATAHGHLDSRVDVYSVNSKRSDTPYFSPSRRHGAALSIVGEWVQWRAYSKSLTHQLTLIGGRDWQRDVAATDVFGGRYAQVLRLSPCTELRYGAEWLRRGYDGKPETRQGAFLSIDHRWLP